MHPIHRKKIGDIYEIPLSNGGKGYAQYVFFDKQWGDLVQVLDLILNKNQELDIEMFKKAKPLFRPVITHILVALNHYKWKLLGNITVKNFVYPGFLSGWPKYWFLWDGEKEIPLGETVPDRYKHLEYLTIYSPENITKRVITGVKPDDEMIKTNKNPKRKNLPE